MGSRPLGEHFGSQTEGLRRSGVSERYVALLRGINVGQANRVAMADLRSLVTRSPGLL